jgi:hypothetical protein
MTEPPTPPASQNSEIMARGQQILQLASIRGKLAFMQTMLEEAQVQSSMIRIGLRGESDPNEVKALLDTLQGIAIEIEQAMGLMKLTCRRATGDKH